MQQYSQWKCGQTSTGINELQNLHFEIFPNPSSGIFEINFKDNLEHKVNLYNMMGILIVSKMIMNTEIINLTSIPSGIYFIQVDNSKSEKIIKK